jgi:glutathione synthase/RimK-type ligase-like ATP-grasp enzyme
MLRKLFGDEGGGGGGGSSRSGSPPLATLLVLQEDSYDWPALLRGARLDDGRGIRVIQTGWAAIEVHVSTYSTAGLCVEVLRLAKTASDPEGPPVGRLPLTIKPDYVLVRNEVTSPTCNRKNVLNGLLFADVPAMNSLESVLLSCEKPAMLGQLHRIQRRLGREVFPVMDQHFASSSRCLMYGYTFPAVVKIGSAHAGAGKMKISDHHQMHDFTSVLEMMQGEHCTVEPFIKGEADLRIQKIGRHYRAFRRRSVSGSWKTNTGTSVMDEEEIQERWRRWADAAAEMFGGLDILTVDAIVEEGTGREYILEVNGTSSGLHPDRAAEDNGHIRDLLLEKMNAMFGQSS